MYNKPISPPFIIYTMKRDSPYFLKTIAENPKLIFFYFRRVKIDSIPTIILHFQDHLMKSGQRRYAPVNTVRPINLWNTIFNNLINSLSMSIMQCAQTGPFDLISWFSCCGTLHISWQVDLMSSSYCIGLQVSHFFYVLFYRRKSSFLR